MFLLLQKQFFIVDAFSKKTLLSKPKLMYAAVLPESPILSIRGDRDLCTATVWLGLILLL